MVPIAMEFNYASMLSQLVDLLNYVYAKHDVPVE